jgi:hypothetical protein
MRHLLLIMFLVAGMTGMGQTTYNKFIWASTPSLHTVEKEFADEPAVYVQDQRFIEYVIEKDGFYQYRTLHKIIHINNDLGIEHFNKIYLPFNEGLEMVDVKARTILPGGRIIEMDRKNIKDLMDEDGEYKIFALEGLTKGCEVEYYFTIKKYPSFFGREVLSGKIPVMNAHFELVTPAHLEFESRSYNNLPAGKEKVSNEKRYTIIDDKSLPGAEEEKYSMYQASLKRVEFKLSYNNTNKTKERLFTWNELGKKVYDIYTSVSDKDQKRIKDLLSNIKISYAASDQEKITKIENYLKKEFIVREDISDEDADDLGKVIKGKIASEKAICKMYMALFSTLGMEHHIVLAGDRDNFPIDKTFENWNNAKNFLIYFPSTGKYMAPTATAFRYPWMPPTWTSTNALFCIGTTIGSFRTAVAEIRPIPMESYEHSYSNMDIKLKMDKDDALIVDVKQTYGGYTASNYRLPFVYMPADEQDKFLKQLVKFGTNSENILSSSIENRELEQADPYKPFVINASVRSTSLMERAGNKLLIKVGECIGEQAELYEARPRTTDIDVTYPHALIRTIELLIPEGYQVKNLSDLNFNQVIKENDKVVTGFVSSYEQQGNKLKITIREDYKNVFYPIQQYEGFKKVINAAADFNKVVLILDKVG